ncbi:MAG: EamA family transporter [Planctomycetales bacterium]|nr:EamA family transporter [Planctomycetales bacterium]
MNASGGPPGSEPNADDANTNAPVTTGPPGLTRVACDGGPTGPPGLTRVACDGGPTGRLLVLSAAVLWSTSGLFAALLPFSGLVLAFWRALFAGGLLLPLVRQPRWSWRLAPMMLAFAAMNYTFLTALVEGDATCTIWLQHTAPAWVVVMGVLFFGETPGRRDWAMLPWALAGVGLILSFELRGESPRAVLFGLLSGVTYAFVVLSIRQLREFDSQWLVSLNLLFTAAVLSPFALGQARPAGWQYLGLAMFGLLQMGAPYVLFARGLRRITGLQASSIVLIEPLLVPVWVYLVRGDIPRTWTLIGAGLILIGLVRQTRSAAVQPAASRRSGKISTSTPGE